MRETLCALLAFMVILAAGFLLPRPAYPHSWYDPDCCHDKDCAPVADNVVEVTPGGFYIKDGWNVFIERGSPKIRQSQDAHYHVCGYKASMMTVVYCLYVPSGGV